MFIKMFKHLPSQPLTPSLIFFTAKLFLAQTWSLGGK
uniref:Uncharacterized protein n=1 Tax=Anguilla anguilla TaxID=7936 RepID=A0A0E9VLH0_ANGAN